METIVQIYTSDGELQISFSVIDQEFVFENTTVQMKSSLLSYYFQGPPHWINFHLRLSGKAPFTAELFLDFKNVSLRMFSSEGQDWKSYIFLGGGPNTRFYGELRGIVTYVSSSLPSNMVDYGSDEILINQEIIPQDGEANSPPKIIDRNVSHSFEFNLSEFVTLKFNIKIFNQSEHYLGEGCDILSLEGNNGEDEVTIKLSNETWIEFEVCSNRLGCFKEDHDGYIAISFLYQEELELLRIIFQNGGILSLNYSSQAITVHFGGNRRKGCHFLPYNLLLYHGGNGYISQDEVPNGCLRQDMFKTICYTCEKDYKYNFITHSCDSSCEKDCGACKGDVTCLKAYQNSVVYPFCKSWDGGACTECVENYSLSRDGKCQLHCQEDEIAEYDPLLESFHCVKCSSKLKNCWTCGYSSTRLFCTKCSQGTYLLNNTQCVEKCPSLSVGGKCTTLCPNSTFPNDQGECKNCSLNCKDCINDDICTQCRNPFILIDGRCYEPDCKNIKMYQNKPYCPPCPLNCDECLVNNSKMQCTKCTNKTILYQGICVESCPNDTIIDVDHCYTENHFIQFPNGTQLRAPMCPEGYGTEIVNDTLSKCFLGTSSCGDLLAEDNTFRCKTCKNKFYMLYMACFSQCPAGSYSSHNMCQLGNEKCQNRDPVCLECSKDHLYYETVKLQGICRACKLKLPFQLRFPTRLQSGENPDSAIVYNKNIFSCNLCENCLQCDNGKCLRCDKGYFLHPLGFCSLKCPSRTFANNYTRRCDSCPESCLSCESESKCLVCQAKILQDGICKQTSMKSRNGIYKLSYNNLLRFEESIILLTLEPQLIEFEVVSVKNASNLISYIKIVSNCSLGLDCLVCEVEFSSNLDTLRDRKYNCSCPLEELYYDHNSQKCVQKCPEDTLIIPKTRECVTSCKTVSMIQPEHPFLFQYQNFCLDLCPEGYFPQTELHMLDDIICIPMKSFDLYNQSLSILEDSFETPPCLKNSSHLFCVVNHTWPTLFGDTTLIPEYINTLLLEDNFWETLLQPKSIFIISYYLYNIKMVSPENIQKSLQILENILFACQSSLDLYYILRNIDYLLQTIQSIDMDLLEKLPILLEYLTGCFEKTIRNDSSISNKIFQGTAMLCAVHRPEEYSFTEDDSKDFLILNEFEGYKFETNLKYFSISKNGFMILDCQFNLEINKGDFAAIRHLGFLNIKVERWWNANLSTIMVSKSAQNRFYIWDSQIQTWVLKNNSTVSGKVSCLSLSQSFSYMVIPKSIMELSVNRKRVDPFLFFCILLLVLSLLVYLSLKLMKKCNKKKLKKKKRLKFYTQQISHVELQCQIEH